MFRYVQENFAGHSVQSKELFVLSTDIARMFVYYECDKGQGYDTNLNVAFLHFCLVALLNINK